MLDGERLERVLGCLEDWMSAFMGFHKMGGCCFLEGGFAR